VSGPRREVNPMPRSNRRHSAKVKFRAVLEVLTGERSPGQVARVYRVHPNSLKVWKDKLLEHGPEIFERSSPGGTYEKRIAELEQLIGKKEIEIALLKNFLGRTD
jgi:transposase-like protein